MRYEPLGKYVSLSQGQVVNKSTAQMFSEIQNEDYPYPLLRIVDFENGNHAVYSRFVSKDVPPKVVIEEDAILFTRVTCQCFRGFKGVFHNNLFRVSLINDEITEDYLYTALQSNYVRNQALKLAASSVVPDLSHDMFKSILIPVPDRVQQDGIASLYLSIEEKIKSNNAIGADLEAMAKLLYDYWFVQFDFPDENGKPYKSSGGKMVWNDDLKREIPEGWEAVSISDLAYIKTESVIPKEGRKYFHFSIPAYDDAKQPIVEDGMYIDSNKYVVPENSILVSKLNPQFKRVWLVVQPELHSICSTELIPIIPNGIGINSLFSIFNSDAYSVHLRQKASSSTGSRKRIDPENMISFVFSHNQDVYNRFESIIEPVYKMIQKTYGDNQELSSLRDFLLPMLMNGQVKVSSN